MVSLNAAVIGAGERARSHISTLLKLKDRFRLVAVCDVDEARVRKVANETGARPYVDLEKMIGREKLDVCLIAVQAEGHHVVARALAEKGVHILTETPMAITVACALQMIEAAEGNGVFLEVSENVPRWPHERLKQKIVAGRLLGEVKEFYLSYTSGSYHGIAAIRSILKAEAETVIGEFPTKDSVLEKAKISFSSGVKGVYEFNRDRGNYWEIIGSEGALRGIELHLFKDNQKLRIQTETAEVEGKPRVVGATVATEPNVSFETPLKDYPLADHDEVAIADAWLSLYDTVVNDKPLSYGAENARKDVELLMAIRDSALRNGIEVRLPLSGVTEHEKMVHEEFAKVYGLDPLESSLRHLKVRYVLPERLRELMYCGRFLQSNQ